MKKSTKVLLGILSFLPILFIIIYFVGFFTVLITQIPELEQNTGEIPTTFLSSIFGLLLFLILAGIIKLGLTIYYIIHASENPKNDSNKKIMWILILIFFGTIGNVVYYFLEIYPIDTAQKNITQNII